MALTGAGLNSMRSIPTFGTVGAISEIVDNSIQWKLDNKDIDINIIFIQRNKSLDEILITDNGQGMGLDIHGNEIIDFCLLFGGGTNHGAKSNLGKFGIGLPYACCSQSEDYHIYSWQRKGEFKHKWRNHSDFNDDDIVEDKSFEILHNLPKDFYDYLPHLSSYESGTIVQWKNCDRLTYKTAKTLIKHIERKLGITYRYFIDNGVNINFLSFNKPKGSSAVMIEDLCKPINKFDPLFLSTGTILPNEYKNNPPSEAWLKEPKILYFSDRNGTEHRFEIRASLAKKIIQMPNCKAGGNTELGRLYKEVQGISIVRAKRELRIHHFNFNFPNGVSDPRHRWWKVELRFEPISDELLGVNANKTDALNFRYITDEDHLDNSIDYINLRHELTAIIQDLIIEMWLEMKRRVKECKSVLNPKYIKCPQCGKNTFKNGKCENPECGFSQDYCPEHGIPYENGKCKICEGIDPPPRICPIHKVSLNENGICPRCEETQELNQDEKDELIELLKYYGFLDSDNGKIDILLNWFVRSNKKHFVIFVDNPNAYDTESLFEISKIGEKFKIILVYKDHPFYESHIGPLRDIVNSDIGMTISHDSEYDFQAALESIILFIINWVETETQSTSDLNSVKRFRKRFSINLSEVLDVWQHLSS